MNTETNGQPTTNAQREEREQEGSKGFYLFKSSSATDRNFGREKGSYTTVHIENTNCARCIFVNNTETKTTIRGRIYNYWPSLFSANIGIEFFTAPIGSEDRKVVGESIQNYSQIWATVYLQKH